MLVQKLKYVALLFFICFFSELSFAQKPQVDTKYPIFQELNPKSKVIGVFDFGQKHQLLDTKADFILEQPASIASHSGLKYYRDCFFIRQAGKQGWVIDGIFVEDKKLKTDFRCNRELFPVLLGFICVLLLSLILLTVKCFKKNRGKDFFSVRNNVWLAISSLLLLRCVLILTVLYRAGKFVIGTKDVKGYFITGQVLFKTLDFSQCQYPVGHSFLIGISSLITGSDAWCDTALPFSYFNSLFLGSCLGLLMFYAAYTLFKSKSAGLICLLIYVLYPFVLQVNHTGGIYARDFLSTPAVYDYSIRLYYWSAMVGFNALSDFTNEFYIFALFVLSLFLTGNRDRFKGNRRIIIILGLGLLFGISGTIRLSNIYFILLFIYIINRDLLTLKGLPYKSIFISIFIFGVGTSLGFSPQLAANYLQDGNVFTLPYHIYHGVEYQKGFELSNFSQGAGMIFNASSFLLCLSVCGIYLTPIRYRFMFSLFIIPLLYFYCGYYGASNSVRFILPVFPGLILLAQQAFRKSPYSVFGALFLLYICKSQFYKSQVEEFKYIALLLFLIILICSLFYILNKTIGIREYRRIVIDFVLIVFMQILIIVSLFPNWGWISISYLLLFLISPFIKEKITVKRDLNSIP